MRGSSGGQNEGGRRLRVAQCGVGGWVCEGVCYSPWELVKCLHGGSLRVGDGDGDDMASTMAATTATGQ